MLINGIDPEQAGAHNKVSRTRIATKYGSIVQLKVKNAPVANTGTDLVIEYLVYDALLQIKDGSADVFE